MLYHAVHVTRYRYDGAVSQCQTEARLTPRSLPWQHVLKSGVTTSPAPSWTARRVDYFGNDVHTFAILERHDRFTTTATSRVRVEPRPVVDIPDAPWEAARDALAGYGTGELLDAFEFTFDSPFVTAARELAEYAQPTLTPGRPLVEAIDELTRRIHAEFTYKPASTAIDTPLLDTLRSRQGVCQDFAHLMIGALRTVGLAARYVSGYLRSGADHQGAEASHAWVGVFVPGYGWLDVDPTNNVRAGLGHVTLGWGRDYADVTPVKGITHGGGRQAVDVEVRVDPIEG